MSGSDSQSSRRRGGGYNWVPLAITLTVATAGVAAWLWSQRDHDDGYDSVMEEEDDDTPRPGRHSKLSRSNNTHHLDYENPGYSDNSNNRPYGTTTTTTTTTKARKDRRDRRDRDDSSTVSDAIKMTKADESVVGSTTSGRGGGGGGGSESGNVWASNVASGSPQQWMGSAGKAVSAGVAAASAAVGGALASIREGDKDPYADHETWSQEVDARKNRKVSSSSGPAQVAATTTTTTATPLPPNQSTIQTTFPPPPTTPITTKAATTATTTTATTKDATKSIKSPSTAVGAAAAAAAAAVTGAAAASAVSKDTTGRKRKSVAIVVSADSNLSGGGDFHEHGSILSYIPHQIDYSKTRVYVLIYAPNLKDSSSLDASGNVQPNSLSSSFSNIGPETPGSEIKNPIASDNAAFNAVRAEALSIVEKDSDIIPFTTVNGHAHILHILEPDIVYLQESLTGDNGAVVNQLQNWMRQEIVVVVGAESGYGGLADSESEAEKTAASKQQKWWQKEERVGRGRGVVVVDGMRVNDDWVRRVQGQN